MATELPPTVPPTPEGSGSGDLQRDPDARPSQRPRLTKELMEKMHAENVAKQEAAIAKLADKEALLTQDSATGEAIVPISPEAAALEKEEIAAIEQRVDNRIAAESTATKADEASRGGKDIASIGNGSKSENEITPDERRQRKIEKLILARPEDVEGIFNKWSVDISPEESAQARALLSDPDTMERIAGLVLDNVKGVQVQKEYINQFELMRDSAEKKATTGSAKPLPEGIVYARRGTPTKPEPAKIQVEGAQEVSQLGAEKKPAQAAEEAQWEALAALVKSGGQKAPTERTQEEQMAALFKKLSDESAKTTQSTGDNDLAPPTGTPETAIYEAAQGEANAEAREQSDEVALSGTDHDRTPLEGKKFAAEAREKLRNLVARAGEKFGIPEKKERLANYCAERSKAIQESAKAYGSNPEKIIRDIGEQYNKLSFTKKLGIGFGLGVGAAAFSTVSAPIAFVFGGLLTAQRVAGGASMYLKMEEHLLSTSEGRSSNFLGKREWYRNLFTSSSERQRKILAGIMAATWTIGSGIAVKELVQLGSETQFAETVQQWLKDHWFGGTSAVSETSTGSSPEVPSGTSPVVSPENLAEQQEIIARLNANGHPEISASLSPEDIKAAIEGAQQTIAETQASMSTIMTVGASPHGYEGMLKDLAKMLPETRPHGLIDGSDLAKLYEAKTSADPEELGKAIHRIAMNHKFFTDQGSFRVDASAHMSADSSGNILFNGQIEAPTDAHFTSELPRDAASQGEAMEVPRPPTSVEGTEAPTVTAESPSPVPVAPTESLLHDKEIATGVIGAAIVANSYGVKVSPAESHIYMDEKKLYVHGGSPEERRKQAAEYLKVHPSDVIYDVDENGRLIPLGLVDGNLTAGEPALASEPMDRVLGLFRGPKLAPPPDPAQFRRIIR